MTTYDTYEDILLAYATKIDDKEIEIDTPLKMPWDNIVFMKHYFKAKGFNPESEDFITEILKSQDFAFLKKTKPISIPLSTITPNYPYNWSNGGTSISYNLNNKEE